MNTRTISISALVFFCLAACAQSSRPTESDGSPSPYEDGGQRDATQHTDTTPQDEDSIYLSATGTDNGACPQSAPCRTLQYALEQLPSGGTLIIEDGTYTGAENVIDNDHHPPMGLSSSAPTTIKAANTGKVIFDGEDMREMFSITGKTGGHNWLKYWRFEGIQWVRSSGSAVSIVNGDHSDFTTGYNPNYLDAYVYLKDCAGHGDGTTFYFGYVNFVLMEGCWGWGNGRYGISFYLCDNSIVRRHVDRRDALTKENSYPSASFMNYASKNIEWQNCISIDVDSNYFSTDNGGLGCFGGFYIREAYVERHSENTTLRGCIVVNYDASAGMYGAKLAGVYTKDNSINTKITNTMIMGSSNGFCVADMTDDIEIEHCGVAEAAHDTSYSYAYGDISQSGTDFLDVTNSYALNNTFLRAFAGMSSSSDHNGAFNNEDNTVSPGSHNVTTNPNIRYPLRTEAGSSYENAASDGGDIGPTILKQYGVEGTFFDQDGYATLGESDLWPWKNEDLIKAAMSNDYGESEEVRGFCAGTSLDHTAQTLTKYIWEFFGNEIPSDIYE